MLHTLCSRLRQAVGFRRLHSYPVIAGCPIHLLHRKSPLPSECEHATSDALPDADVDRIGRSLRQIVPNLGDFSPSLRGQGQDRLRQLIFVRAPQRQMALRSSPLPHPSARPPFTHFVLLTGMLHAAPTSLPAWRFPSAISFEICLSSDSSASNRFNLPFSSSKFFQPLRLVHLRTAAFLAPAIEHLHRHGGFLAGSWGGIAPK